MKKLIFSFIFIFFTITYAAGGKIMIIKSTSYPNEGLIPKKYVMKKIGGENISPELSWENIPNNAKSFALIMVDPHPIARNWVHWAVVNIPTNITKLEQGFSMSNQCPTCRELINSFGFKGYGGPQPPKGTGKHPYVTYIFALDVETVNIPERISYEGFLEVIKPHILAQGKYTGYFEQK